MYKNYLLILQRKSKHFIIMKKLLLIVIAALAVVACERKNDAETPVESPTITQGIYGQVKERYGNWQPVTDPNDKSHGYRSIERGVYVYEYTTINDFDQHYLGGTYPADKMPKPLVATTTSKANGFYQIQLEPGKYSVFILENGSMYANWGDGDGGIQPVTIEGGSLLQVNLVLDHGVD